MASSSFSASMRSLWHTMTTNDRHASYTSPYRSNRHVPLSGSRHSPLTSVVTDGLDPDSAASDAQSFVSAADRITSSRSPLTSSTTPHDTAYSADAMGNHSADTDVPMQSFEQGLPPPPPISHSWKRIDRWLEDNYEELFENVGQGCTINDMNELEHELDCQLPQDVRDSWQIHDGQERGGRPTGVLFGCMLLDCEEIVQEWNQWRRTNDEFLLQTPLSSAEPQSLPKASSSSSSAPSPQSATAPNWRRDLLARQDSQPLNAIQKAYVHPAWIPLARDWGGNNICIDLAPGPAGQWGQVILMGRDYDRKYVIARSWAAFLANVADDMSTDKWYIDEDTHELKLREFPKQPNIAPAYMDILRWRADQKYGPRPRPVNAAQGRPKRQSLKIDPTVKDQFASLNGFSPYASTSPTLRTAGDRVRSPPRGGHGKGPANPPANSSPLARVTEESGNNTPCVATSTPTSTSKLEKLVTIDSPVIDNSDDGNDDGEGANHFGHRFHQKTKGIHQEEIDGLKAVPL